MCVLPQVLSQWGEIEDFNYPRDKKTGKPRGWCWCKYEDQRSTVLAVDNGNGARLLSRTLRASPGAEAALLRGALVQSRI